MFEHLDDPSGGSTLPLAVVQRSGRKLVQRRRRTRLVTGSAAVLATAAVTAVATAGLPGAPAGALATPAGAAPSDNGAGVALTSRSPAASTPPAATPSTKVTGAPVGSVPVTSGAPTAPPTPATGDTVEPTAPPTPATSDTVTPTEKATGPAVQAHLWSPAGSLIHDQTVLAVAPNAAAHDTDWQAWSGGTLLDQDTVAVVFAESEPIDTSGYPRPLVVVTGRTAPDAALQIGVLTTVAGGKDAANLNSLSMDAMTPAKASGTQAIAVSSKLFIYAVAETGVDSATYTYQDATGSHTAAMKVAGGVAFAPAAAHGWKITNITAVSHGTVVWDAAPVSAS